MKYEGKWVSLRQKRCPTCDSPKAGGRLLRYDLFHTIGRPPCRIVGELERQTRTVCVTKETEGAKPLFTLVDRNEDKMETLHIIPGRFAVCKVQDYSQTNLDGDYCFTGKTDEELSLVCPADNVPDNTTERDDGWRAFRIEGVLDFSLIGILARISTILANEKTGIFAISTYNTDCILTREGTLRRALDALRREGYIIASGEL